MAKKTMRCFKCDRKVEVEVKKWTVMKNGGIRAVGNCPTCGQECGTISSAEGAPKDIVDKSKAVRASHVKGSRKSKKGGSSKGSSKGSRKSKGSKKGGRGSKRSRRSRK
jgi:hypothetical protein